jgi:xanthine/uracil permease
MSTATRRDGTVRDVRKRSGPDDRSLLLVAIVTLAIGIGAATLDDGLVGLVPVVVLLIAGCVSLSAFIIVRTAERP